MDPRPILTGIWISFTVILHAEDPFDRLRVHVGEVVIPEVTEVDRSGETVPEVQESRSVFDWNQSVSVWAVKITQNPETVVELLDVLFLGNEQDLLTAESAAQAFAIVANDRPELHELIAEKLHGKQQQMFWGAAIRHELEHSTRFPDGMRRLMQQNRLLETAFFTELDGAAPDRMITEIDRMTPEMRNRYLERINLDVFLSEPYQLLGLMNRYTPEIESNRLKEYASEGIMQLAKTDSFEAFKWVRRFPEEIRKDLLEVYLLGWASSEPSNALQKLEELPWSNAEKADVQTRILRMWKRNDPKKFFEYVENFPGEQLLEHSRILTEEWPIGFERYGVDLGLKIYQEGKSYLMEEKKVASFMNTPLARGMLVEPLEVALTLWGAKDGQALDAWIDEQEDPLLRGAGVSALCMIAAEDDPWRASFYLNGWVDDIARARAAERILNIFIEQDPESGLRWLQLMSEDELPQSAYRLLFESWASEDVEATMANFPRNRSSEEQRQLAGLVSRNFEQADFELATKWLATLEADVSKQALFNYARSYARIHPEGVLDYVKNNPNLEHKELIERNVFSQLADSDLELAISLLVKGRGQVGEAGVQSVAQHIVLHDPQRFEKMIMNPSWSQLQRDTMRMVYGEELHWVKPERTVEHLLNAEKVEDQRRRVILLSYALYTIGLNDPEKAYNLVVDETRLNDEDRAFLLKRLRSKHLAPKE